MSEYIFCFGCGNRVRRGFKMIDEKGKEIIICEKCHRKWKKLHQDKEKEAEGASNE